MGRKCFCWGAVITGEWGRRRRLGRRIWMRCRSAGSIGFGFGGPGRRWGRMFRRWMGRGRAGRRRGGKSDDSVDGGDRKGGAWECVGAFSTGVWGVGAEGGGFSGGFEGAGGGGVGGVVFS